MSTGGGIVCGLGAALALVAVAPAVAQTTPGAPAHFVPGAWRAEPSRTFTHEADFASAAPEAGFGGAFAMADDPFAPGRADVVSEAWRDTPSGAVDRLRLATSGAWRRADGAPLALGPADDAVLDPDGYSLTYTRGWPSRGYDPETGLQVEVIPHAGFGVGSGGGSAEAGATIRIGSSMERLVPEGEDAFDEDQSRWYVFAAGSSRAVGYNFARTRDGDYVRSGMSHDSGAFIGDAQVGLAWRRGDMQTSFGYVYRRHKVRELAGRDFERVQTEGVLAFQLSIRPDW